MPTVDEDLVELDSLIKGLQFADSESAQTARDLLRMRILVANLRVHIAYLREQLGDAG